ncbi:MAG: Hpt domain-containing protein [Actinomycetia bacterium]|nr:Hpt domain-containing protein [Actinomycetes bacterium]
MSPDTEAGSQDLPLVNESRLVELANELEDSDLVAESLGLFLAEFRHRLADIQSALRDESQPASTGAAIHALGSPAAMLGLDQLAATCRHCEHLALSNSADITVAVARLIQQAEQTKAAVSDYLISHPNGPT